MRQNLIKVFTSSDFDVFIPEIISVNRPDSSKIRPTFININNPWILIISNGFIEEFLSRTFHSSFGEKEVNGVSKFINSSIKIRVFTSYLTIGFIHPPAGANSIFSFVHRCLNQGSLLKHPTLNSRMVNLDTSNLHKLFNVSIGERKTKL